MARTRSKPAPKPKATESTPETPTSNAKALPETTANPPKLFILPRDASKDARIVTLDNPANETPSRYYFCPQKGFYEFTRIAAPRKECKSWLITGDNAGDGVENMTEQDGRIGSGYITKSADMFVATPIDLLFLILPALAPKNAKDTKQHFLALDDYFDQLSTSSRHWRALISEYSSLRPMIEKKMRKICDTVDAGDETMFRISHQKVLDILLSKAERMTKHGLPRSLEDKYIKTALEVPVMNIKREASNPSVPDTSSSGTPAASPSCTTETAPDSQVSTCTTLTTPDIDIVSSIPALETPLEIPTLLRLRTALTYLTSSYIPPPLRPILSTLLSTHTSYTFSPLDTHLAAIAALRSEAAALRSISDNISRKRAYDDDDDDEKIAQRVEKKRKKEEEEKRKKSEGRGVKQLKKVDTSGMKKMSAFFAKVAKKV